MGCFKDQREQFERSLKSRKLCSIHRKSAF